MTFMQVSVWRISLKWCKDTLFPLCIHMFVMLRVNMMHGLVRKAGVSTSQVQFRRLAVQSADMLH